jgi:hypothetical protein
VVLFDLDLYDKVQARVHYYRENGREKMNIQLQEELSLLFLQSISYAF